MIQHEQLRGLTKQATPSKLKLGEQAQLCDCTTTGAPMCSPSSRHSSSSSLLPVKQCATPGTLRRCALHRHGLCGMGWDLQAA